MPLKPLREHADVNGVHESEPCVTEAATYLRVTLAENDQEVSMTLYEVDPNGWVHRQCQMRTDGLLFAPEDILMCRPVNLGAMLAHPCSEEIDRDDFELLWAELATERCFLSRIPDPRRCWEGTVEHAGRARLLRWQPQGTPPACWASIPGFGTLYVQGDAEEARSMCSAVFLDREIRWRSVGSTLSRGRAREAA